MEYVTIRLFYNYKKDNLLYFVIEIKGVNGGVSISLGREV